MVRVLFSRRKAKKTEKTRRMRATHRVMHQLATTHMTRQLGGYPEKLKVRLPYTFAYNVTFPPDGTEGGDLLALFCGNGYPNVGGYNSVQGIVSQVECPTNLFSYGAQYGRALVTGCKIDITAAFAGTYQQYSGTDGWQGPLNNALLEPPVVALTAFPLDFDDSAGSFRWNGVSSMAPRPGSVTSTGDVTTLLGYNLEQMMSVNHTSMKSLTNIFGGSCKARFSKYFSTKKFIDCGDLEDVDEASFIVPYGPTAPASNGQSAPPRGFGLALKAFVRNGASAGSGAGTNWQISGRITYYYTFSGLRPITEADWVPT